jgi:DUF3060 family protein
MSTATVEMRYAGTMLRLISLVFVCSVAASGIAAADSVYAGAKNVTHDCAKEPSVTINDGEGSYKFTGTCARIAVMGGENKLTIAAVKDLAITGGDNTIDVDAADKISVTGSGNKVTYKKGLSGAKPKVSTIGTDNKIKQVK